MSASLSAIGIANINGADYCCIRKGYKINATYQFDRNIRNIIKHKYLLSHIQTCKEN